MAVPSDRAKRVAFLGPRFSYTHQATVQDFPEERGFVHIPCTEIEEVFFAVQDGSVAFGIVPFENSTNGIVDITFHLFAGEKGKVLDDTYVCGEAYVGIHHYLLGFSPDSEPRRLETAVRDPEGGLGHIKTLYSHPQVWSQCGKFLANNLKNVARQNVSSTAEAARMVSDSIDKSSAAISSLAAGQACHLDVLAKTIEDKTDNQTRFLILRRLGDSEDAPCPEFLRNTNYGDTWKTFVNFTISPASPSKLAEALGVFEYHGLSVTNITSLPSGIQPWHYTYFVEFEGHKDNHQVQGVLAKLKDLCMHYRWHGNFKDRRKE